MNFTVYSKDGCPYCTKVVQVLELAKLNHVVYKLDEHFDSCLLYTSPSPRDVEESRMPSSA